jgi:hypothetical protein
MTEVEKTFLDLKDKRKRLVGKLNETADEARRAEDYRGPGRLEQLNKIRDEHTSLGIELVAVEAALVDAKVGLNVARAAAA